MQRTLLIVDDHEGFRSWARALLEHDGFDVVGEACDGRSALEMARSLGPDVILLDIALPELDGFAVCDELSSHGIASVVVLTSSRDASSYRRRMAGSAAAGFIPKSDLSGKALEALVGAPS